MADPAPALEAGAPAPTSPPPARAPWRRAVLCHAAVLGLFFAPALLGAGVFAYRDTGRMHGPDKRLVAERLAAGALPEWNPWGGLGYPLVGGAVDAVQHPFNLLLLVLQFDAAFTAWILLSFLLAALGTRAWARALGLSEPAAVAAGLGVALSGFLVSSTDNVCYLSALAAVPLVLAAAHRFVGEGGPRRAAGLALAGALAAAAGDPQSFGIAAGVLPLYALAFVDGPPARVRLLRAAVGVAIVALAAAPFLLPVLAWLPHSARADPLSWLEHARYHLLPIRLLEHGLPGLFGLEPVATRSELYQAYAGDAYTPAPWVMSEYLGATVLALAALGARRSRRAALLLAGAAAFAWAAMGRAAGFGSLAERLPLLSGLRYWEKLSFFTALLAVAAAAFGLDAWLCAPGRTGRFARLTAGAGALLLALRAAAWLFPAAAVAAVARPGAPAASAALAANLGAGLVHSGLALLALAAVAALSARGRLAGGALAVAAAAVIAADLGAANLGAYVLVPPEAVRPPSAFAERLRAEPGAHRVFTPFPLDERGPPPARPFERAMRYGAATLASGWNVDARVGNFEAYTGLLPARAMRFLLRTGWSTRVPQVGMWGVDLAVVPADDPDPGRMGLAPPHEVVAEDVAHAARLVRLVHRPRAYLAAQVREVDRRGAMEFVLSAASVGSAVTVVEGPLPAGLGSGGAPGTARLAADEPERVVVRVEAERPALLVLNDTFAPGWTAAVDGVAVPILPANYLARGVPVPAGAHTVEFRYRTPLLAAGWAAAAALAAALCAWAALARRRPRPT